MMRALSLIAPLLWATLTGCAGAPKENFYVLSASVPRERVQMAASMPNIRIVIGPVAISEIVDRPQLVTRSAPHQVAILEQERWAESLKGQISRVVAENLAMLLGTPQVSVFAQGGVSDADYRVTLEVQRFESVLNEAVTVEALWVIHHSVGGKLTGGHSLVHEPVASPGYNGLVAAHSHALGSISHDIAAALRDTAVGRPATVTVPGKANLEAK